MSTTGRCRFGDHRMSPPYLRPFWRYYGGAWRIAARYPAPRHRTLIEPFAGAAGYALRHYRCDAVLVEKYPVIAGIWRYLIAAPAAEILRIPTADHVDELPSWVPQEARWLVGMTMNSGAVSPNRKISAGMAAFRDSGRGTEGWCDRMRERAARQVQHIRHWRVIESDFTSAPDVQATWFIDPPFAGRAGSHYVHGSKAIDFVELGAWCRSRRGQVIVRESAGATWLPFRRFGSTNGVTGRQSGEALWTTEETQLDLFEC